MAVSFLTEQEVPESVRAAFDFKSQRLKASPAHSKLSKRKMSIVRTCLRCGEKKRILVTYVRQAIKKGNLTGLCRPCSLATIPRNRATGENHWLWKGGEITLSSGYIMLRRTNHPNAKNGYEFEHRLVMEEHLGRYLLPNETVHHKNGIKDDNGLENLELFSGNHSDGVRYEDMSIEQLEMLLYHIKTTLAAKKAIRD